MKKGWPFQNSQMLKLRINGQKNLQIIGITKEWMETIAVDLDGTVFGADHRTIPPHTMAVLKQYVEHGSMVVPVTGRSQAIVPLDSFPSSRYLITSNGGYISDLATEEVLRTAYIPDEYVKTAWRIVRDRVERFHVVMELFVDEQIVVEKKVYEQFDAFEDKLPRFHRAYISSGYAEYAESFDAYLENPDLRVVKINFPGKSIRECPEIREELAQTGLFEVTSDGLNLELTRKGCHKGEALLWLADHLGISMRDVAAFGNGSNDVSMLVRAGYGVAMGNSADDVKAAAGYCTRSNLEDGIAHFLTEHFPLQGK